MSVEWCKECDVVMDADECIYEEDGTYCEECHDEEFQKQLAYWKPRYEGEKLAGLLPANHYEFNR